MATKRVSVRRNQVFKGDRLVNEVPGDFALGVTEPIVEIDWHKGFKNRVLTEDGFWYELEDFDVLVQREGMWV